IRLRPAAGTLEDVRLAVGFLQPVAAGLPGQARQRLQLAEDSQGRVEATGRRRLIYLLAEAAGPYGDRPVGQLPQVEVVVVIPAVAPRTPGHRPAAVAAHESQR